MANESYQIPGRTVRAAYARMVSSGAIEEDPAQLGLIEIFDELLRQVANKRLSSKSSALGWLFGKSQTLEETIKGLYIWGDVGRGKSLLMDLFFAQLPHKRKRRAHFNDFMQDAQERIHAHRQAFKAGKVKESDPIPVIGAELAEEARVLCFDEFTVTDIADAMILGRLFEAMFREGVVIVATSNVEPANLYKNGLNRNLFLPFIDLLQQHVNVVELNSRTDFRLEKLNRAPVYLTPITPANQKQFGASWQEISGTSDGTEERLKFKGRELIVPYTGNGAARISFDALCREPRSPEDFLALARRYHTLFIDGIPVMTREDQSAAKRFILLIDTLYDNHIKLVATAEAEPMNLYNATSGTEAFEFQRTQSRLIEMQSVEYIGG